MKSARRSDPCLMKATDARAELAAILAAGIVRSIVSTQVSRADSVTGPPEEKESGSAANHLDDGAPAMAPCATLTAAPTEAAR
jgi:hypothetical protein